MYKIAKYHFEHCGKSNLQFIHLFVELLEMFIAEMKINQSTFCSHLNPTQVIFFHFGWKVQ